MPAPTASRRPARIDEALVDDDLIDDLDELDDEEEESLNRRIAGVSAWGISLVIHVTVFAICALIVFASFIKDDVAPIRVTAIEPPQEEEKPEEVTRDIVEVETDIESEVIVEDATITELDLPVKELETEDEVITDVPVKGREEADAASEMGGAMSFMAIGGGGGASGAFGSRNGGGRRRAIGRYGGTKASESAVEAALRWFMRHQSPNGQWDVDGYPVNCEEAGPKCDPDKQPPLVSMVEADIACSAYALLCFLGAGYDHRTANRYQVTVQKGLTWLVDQQQASGLFGKFNYEHAVATMALAEAYAMTNDPNLRDPTQKGVDILLERQCPGIDDPAYPLAWDYEMGKLTRLDSSVTGWCVMALKSAKAGGIDVGNGMEGAKRWLEACWKSHNANWEQLDHYDGMSTMPYTWNANGGKPTGFHANRDLTCVGLLCGTFLGQQGDDVMLSTMANHIMANQTPDAYPCNTYWMYYNTLGIFQMGGERFKIWNETVRDMLVQSQRKDGCFDGSWDSEGTKFVGSNVGRLVSTAYCCLSLEVYYRYLPMAVRK